jgi:hypothetical protein
LFVKDLAVSSPGPAVSGASAIKPHIANDPNNGILTIRSGEVLRGVSVLVGQNASGLRGKIIPSTDGAQISAGLRIYLLPAEREQTENLLRFYEGAPERTGGFYFLNLAPGKYLIVTRVLPRQESGQPKAPQIAFDVGARTKLRKEAEESNNIVELRPCQRVSDFVLKLKATP